MTRVLRIALLSLLGIVLLAGPLLAGPGGRNGDPDRPQRTYPVYPVRVEEAAPSASQGSGSALVSNERQLSVLWQRVIRLYFRMNGVSIR